jgi:hypothetical protein
MLQQPDYLACPVYPVNPVKFLKFLAKITKTLFEPEIGK